MSTVERARNWARAHALPLWAEQGWDAARGGFYERLFMDGRPDETAPRRARVQARQIYVYACADVLGWHDGAALASKALDVLVERAWRAGGRPGWAHLLSPEGEVIDPRRDAYDHAFFLFGLAWHHRATGDAQSLSLARETIDFLDEALGAERGYLESDPPVLPRRQNPHMHLLEAFLALYEATGDKDFLARAGRMKQLFDEVFFDAGKGALREFFTADWAPADGPAGRIVEPGHHMEWVWLLSRYDAASGENNQATGARLYDFALEHGSDARTGFLVDEIDVDGAMMRASRRSWPQTELIKAAAAMHEAGRAGARETGEAALGALLDTYLDVDPKGGWIDQYDENGQPVSTTMPASTFYHLFCAMAEAERVFGARALTEKA